MFLRLLLDYMKVLTKINKCLGKTKIFSHKHSNENQSSHMHWENEAQKSPHLFRLQLIPLLDKTLTSLHKKFLKPT